MTISSKDFDKTSRDKKTLTGVDFLERGNTLEQAGDDVGAFIRLLKKVQKPTTQNPC